MDKNNKLIGIIGGMGPFASSYFYKLLLKKSSDDYGAKNNDDFPEVLIDSVPVPDFISNIDDLKTARRMLIDRVLRMNKYGVSSVSMICNTGHILHEDLSKVSRVNFYSMVDVVCNQAYKKGYKKVGVLATPTTVKFDLYGKALSKNGIKVIYPKNGSLALHEKIIRDMVSDKKVMNDIKRLEISTKKLIKDNNLDGIILGCTELPLVFPKNKFKNVIDCMEVLAGKLLEKYYSFDEGGFSE